MCSVDSLRTSPQSDVCFSLFFDAHALLAVYVSLSFKRPTAFTDMTQSERRGDAHLLRSAVLLPGALAVSKVGGAPAFLSSSSLSEPPEELLSEATSGAFLPSPAGPGELLTSADRHVQKNTVITLLFIYCQLQLRTGVCELDVSLGSADQSGGVRLTALLVVLFGLFIDIAAARFHRRAAPGICLCTVETRKRALSMAFL